MAFTDDDLKKWKEWCESFSPQARKLPMIAKEEALLARMEAAEKWAILMWERCDRNDRPVSLAEIEWRKAAGK